MKKIKEMCYNGRGNKKEQVSKVLIGFANNKIINITKGGRKVHNYNMVSLIQTCHSENGKNWVLWSHRTSRLKESGTYSWRILAN